MILRNKKKRLKATYKAKGESGRSKEIFGGWVSHVDDAHGNMGFGWADEMVVFKGQEERDRERGIKCGVSSILRI